MIDKETFDSLHIEGKNTLKDNTEYSISNNYIPDLTSDEMSNYIMNSNITSKNLIK